MYFLIFLPPVAIVFIFYTGFIISAPAYKGPPSNNFNGKVFQNYDGVKAKGFLDVLKWMFSRKKVKWGKILNIQPTKPANSMQDDLVIYFINHSTFYIQWKNLNIVTDPVWSTRVSPFYFAGPERVQPPGILFKDLPKIDMVILSHNHYDHLDIKTLKKLWSRDQPLFIVPLGVDLYLKKKGIKNIKTMEWWKAIKQGPLDVSMVPAQHFSGRGMFDRDKTLWGGYMISDGNEKIYFAGDTGYNQKMYFDIKQQHPKIDTALLPIGAYKPRWFMSSIHTSPIEAVEIHKQLNCKKSIAMHYGTFPLAYDEQLDAPKELQLAMKRSDIKMNDFLLLKEGEAFMMK